MDTTTTMMDAAARYRKEAARAACLREAVEARGDLSPEERQRVKKYLWKTKMLMRGMRSMAAAVGLDPSALAAECTL